jgi:hypothetical protein
MLGGLFMGRKVVKVNRYIQIKRNMRENLKMACQMDLESSGERSKFTKAIGKMGKCMALVVASG